MAESSASRFSPSLPARFDWECGGSRTFESGVVLEAIASPATGGVLCLRSRPEAGVERAILYWLGSLSPPPVNSSAERDGWRLARLSPDEWWVVRHSGSDATLGEEPLRELAIERVLAAAHVVDLSSAFVRFRLSGPGAALALNSGCPLDLHGAAFPVSAATRTVVAKAEVVLVRLADGGGGESRFEVFIPRSFASYVWRWCETTALRL